MQVHSEVDDAVSAQAEDRQELESTIVESVADQRWAGVGEGLVRHGRSRNVKARRARRWKGSHGMTDKKPRNPAT